MKRITFELQGECTRCGECCKALNCEHLAYEKINDMKVAVCKLHGTFWKPQACVSYPHSPENELQKGCGYRWKIVKEEHT